MRVGDGILQKKRSIQLGFLALLFLSLCLAFPKLELESGESDSWKGIDLSASLLESRFQSCSNSEAHKKACREALRYLEEQLRAQSAEGFLPATTHHSAPEKKSTKNFQELLSLLKKQARPESEWVAGALNAWLSAFDPHAQIIPAEKSDQQASNASISVKGIGVKIRIFREKTLVAFVFEGSGAEKSGLRAGDEILNINGKHLGSLSRQEKEKLFRATKAPFQLKIRRGEKLLSLNAEERRYLLPNVEWRVRIADSGIKEGFLRVRSFAKDNTCSEMKAALLSLEAREVERIEIDLRDNPGGLVREAQCAAGLFLGSGRLFARMEKSTSDEILPASPAGYSRANEEEFVLFTEQDRISAKPLLVRINQNTASAAEMLAAALQDAGRAQVFGTRSFGKGSMQSVFHPWDDPKLYFTRTTHTIVRPSGKGLNLSGVTPDVVTERAEGANFPREADLTQ
jgi:carboxyl-terminal processing protease